MCMAQPIGFSSMIEPKALAAERWFGYGRWDAPYWFVGKEPGGADEPEQYASWLRLGGGELIDCRSHDRDGSASDDAMLWHGKAGRLQPSWRPLRSAASCVAKRWTGMLISQNP